MRVCPPASGDGAARPGPSPFTALPAKPWRCGCVGRGLFGVLCLFPTEHVVQKPHTWVLSPGNASDKARGDDDDG